MTMALAPRTALLAAALSLSLMAGGACSFMEEYDLTGKPCNAEGKCRDGFYCSKYDGCQPVDAGSGSRDGGHAASGDAGRSDVH
jgi:hypothetical protein